MAKLTLNWARAFFRRKDSKKSVDIMEQQAKHSPFEGTPVYHPSVRDITLIRRSWSDEFDDIFSLGIDIYAFIFDHAPEAQFLFPQVATAGDRWRELGSVKKQSLKFVQSISQTVKYLADREQLNAFLEHVGRLHVRIAIEQGFHSDLWRVFREAIFHTMQERIHGGAFDERLDKSDRAAALVAWTNLSVMIIQTMHVGYAAGIRDMAKEKI